MGETRFLRWIRRRRRGSRYDSDNVSDNVLKQKQESTFERVVRPLSQLAQIILVAVAIFGYFYTVQPIYQKERLAEQVAQHEIKIDEQIRSIDQAQSELGNLRELTSLEQEKSRDANRMLNEAKDELTELMAEREMLLHSLTLAEQEKSRIESQVKFMRYTHFLPDGTPADTDEEVEFAIKEGRRGAQRLSYFSGLSTVGEFIMYTDDANFAFRQKKDLDRASEFFPFAEEELGIWKNHGLRYPRLVARNVVDTTTTGQGLLKISGLSDDVNPADLESWRAIARDQLENNEDMWIAPYDPLQLVEDYKQARSEIGERLTSELEKAEQEYGDWEKERNARRRDLLERSYDVYKAISHSNANTARFNIEWSYKGYADKFRKSTADEVGRLLDIEDIESN